MARITVRQKEIETPTGLARAHVGRPQQARGTLVLGHGAGGGIGSSDLRLLAEELPGDGWAVVLVEMPWRVAGKKVAPPPARLDAGWVPIVAALTSGRGRLPGPLVVGGRSAGARVACRTASQVGADAVLCLSFPLVPPGKDASATRAPELATPLRAGLPVRVVQGERDPFGTPDDVRAGLAAELGVPLADLPDIVSAAPGTHAFPTRPTPVLEGSRLLLAGL
ncbi:alpha/beta family hydrolase [Janibacter sp. G1551]|uniref:alpha/beta hydrolase family protein n=1 Tax=Janibacter sp. G1551 TaxID=3420440 RepID=UPI003D0003E3